MHGAWTGQWDQGDTRMIFDDQKTAASVRWESTSGQEDSLYKSFHNKSNSNLSYTQQLLHLRTLPQGFGTQNSQGHHDVRKTSQQA